jgi:hypothetical protein
LWVSALLAAMAVSSSMTTARAATIATYHYDKNQRTGWNQHSWKAFITGSLIRAGRIMPSDSALCASVSRGYQGQSPWLVIVRRWARRRDREADLISLTSEDRRARHTSGKVSAIARLAVCPIAPRPASARGLSGNGARG